MKQEQIGYMEAIRWLAKKYNIEIYEKELTAEEKAAQNAREGMIRLNEFAMQTFEKDLYESQEGKAVGLTYFRERGLQDETIKRFHLGYCVEKKTDLAERAKAAGHNIKLLLDPTDEDKEGVGLCYPDNHGGLPQCRFHGRVIFPFMSLAGKPVAFGGRILQRVDHAFKKYVNSPESPIYHKGSMLYGLFQAKKAITQLDKCYIVEGNVDVISMSQAGFENVVASAGTALTTNQINIIKRFTRNVTLMFDGDEAGIRASLKSIDLLLLEGIKVKLLLFPNGDDPDSFCRKHTTEELQAFFAANEQDFISYKTQMLLRDAAGDPHRKSQVLESIVQSIALIEDTIMTSLYIRNTAQALNVQELALLQALNKQKQSNYAAELRHMEIEQRRIDAQAERERQAMERGETPTAETAPALDSRDNVPQPSPQPVSSSPAPIFNTGLPTDICERNIIRYIVRYGGEYFPYSWNDENGEKQTESWRVVDFIGSDLTQENIVFHHPLYAKMLQMAYEASEDPNVVFNSIRFFTCNEDAEVSRLAVDMAEDRNEALGIAKNEEDLSVAIPRVLLEMKECLIRMEIDELQQQLRIPGANYMEILRRYQECKEIKKEIDKLLGERILA